MQRYKRAIPLYDSLKEKSDRFFHESYYNFRDCDKVNKIVPVMQKQLGRVMNRARIKSLFKRLPPGSYSLSSFVFANHLLTGITKTFLSFISLFQRFFVILCCNMYRQ